MGGARAYLKKKYVVPRKAWEAERLEAERYLMKSFGLKRKKELRRAETLLAKLKKRARNLIAKADAKEEAALIKKAYDLGLVQEKAILDDILSLNISAVLPRRLESMLIQKGLANTLAQSRQFIVHCHITVAGEKVKSPAYIVNRVDEDKIAFASSSQLARKFAMLPKKKSFVKHVKKVEEKPKEAEVKKEEVPSIETKKE